MRIEFANGSAIVGTPDLGEKYESAFEDLPEKARHGQFARRGKLVLIYVDGYDWLQLADPLRQAKLCPKTQRRLLRSKAKRLRRSQ